MEFRILGVLEVSHDGQPIPLGGGRQRALLALLLLHRNQPVSGDRIVEEFWDGAAPATAPKVVQNLVSQLRRALAGAEVLHTRGHGYQLTVPDDALDAARFERLLDDGRRALADGDATMAGALLREALGLWRGPALGELADEAWARAEAGRLEERRLVALERRIEADLALGHHADLVGELEAAVAREPLREGLRGQLMLALYRSGRQAEALEAFQDARRTLVDELGIEPSPALSRLHEAILRQEPSLDPAAPPDKSAAPARAIPEPRRRRAAWLLAAGGLVLTVAAVATVIAVDGGDERPRSEGELVGVGLTSGGIERRLPAGRTPSSVAAGEGRLWVVDADARTLIRLDPDSGDVETLATGATPIDVAVGEDAVWVTNGSPRTTAASIGPIATSVARLDPETRTERGVARLPRSRQPVLDHRVERGLAVTPRAVWAVAPSGAVVRIDPSTATVTGTVPGLRAQSIAAGGAGVWALTVDGRIAAVDEQRTRVRRRVRLPSREATAIAVGPTDAWVTSSIDGRLWRIGRDGGDLVGAVDVGSGVAGVAAAGRIVWVANPITGTLTGVDPASMRVVRNVRLGGVPRSLALAGESVWVTSTGRTSAPTGSKVTGIAPVESSSCTAPVAGRDGAADVLVVSDLPLQGDGRLTAAQMSQAITFVMRERGFRAGDFRIAYQSCDDSIAQTGLFDEAKCAANARAYAANSDVVAVIGTLNSPCALAALPELNRAPGGGLVMVSPLNSFVGLTRELPPPDPADLGTLYPTGRRNYARVFPTDDLQGAALALFARERGRRRVFALDDGETGYGALLATGFRRAAGRLGLEVVGRARWRPTAGSFARLADRVAAARPEAVMVSGLLASNAGRVIRELRARLGPEVDLMGPDGLTPLSLLHRSAGPAARGVFVSLSGTVTERLPAAGSRFVDRFGRTQAGVEVDPSAVYAAQATHVVLDAIARSKGTRGTILDQVFRTRVRGGLLGDFAFDARGDITESPVTILRAAEQGSSTNIGSVEGGEVERVLRPSARLVAEG